MNDIDAYTVNKIRQSIYHILLAPNDTGYFKNSI